MLFIRANTLFNIHTPSIHLTSPSVLHPSDITIHLSSYLHVPACIPAPVAFYPSFLPVDAQTTTRPLLQHPCIGSWGCYVHPWNGHAGLCLPPAHWLHAARLQMQHCHRFLH